MRTLTVTEHLSLDGVMQSPSGPDEDPSGGFEHGGWHVPYFDESFARIVGGSIPDTGAYLFGRRTYELMAAHWPNAPADDMFAQTLNKTPKYVASTTLAEPLEWQNTTLLDGDVAAAVAALKDEPGGDIVVLGSGNLAQTLIEHDLVDEYALMIDPLLLGSGKRLFAGGTRRMPLRLVDTKTTDAGVLFATYRRERG